MTENHNDQVKLIKMYVPSTRPSISIVVELELVQLNSALS